VFAGFRKENAQRRTVGHQFLVEAAGIEPASESPLQSDLHT